MIVWIFMGLSTILISEAIIKIFMPGEIIGNQFVESKFIALDAISSFSTQIGGFTNFLLTFTAALAVLALIVGALYISTAFANPEQTEKGKKILLAASLGLVVTISAYALVSTIFSSDNSSSANISISI
jgi:hypothetical protein